MTNLDDNVEGESLQGNLSPGFSSFLNQFSKNRGACASRGYHRVEQDANDPLICYDCDLWFGKEESREMGIVYQVEPL